MLRMNVYKGEQSFADFVRLQSQGLLFDAPAADPADVKRKMDALSCRVVEDLGHEASWADLKDTLKSRAAGKVVYDSALAVASLENALRLRGQAVR